MNEQMDEQMNEQMNEQMVGVDSPIIREMSNINTSLEALHMIINYLFERFDPILNKCAVKNTVGSSQEDNESNTSKHTEALKEINYRILFLTQHLQYLLDVSEL